MKIANLSLNFALAGALMLAGVAAAQNPPQPAAQTAKQNPKRVRTGMNGFDISPQSGKSANQVGGASRDIGSPRLYAPPAAKAYSLRPVFAWGTPDGAEKVTFRLSTPNGVVVYETSTTTGHLKYPSDAPTLSAGATYTWTIIPDNDMMGGTPHAVSVMIVSTPEREAMQSELAAAAGAAAAADVYVQHHVWYDAVEAYSALLDQKPDDQDARSMRASIYDQIPSTKDLADADWAMIH